MAVLAAVGLALSGCSDTVQRGFLPGSDGITNISDRITSLWVHAWGVLLVLALLVWGLIIWCVVVYRHRKGDDRMPVQYRYNMPIEVLYTAVPFILIIAFFAATVQVQSAAEARADSDDASVTRVQVVGKQWSWDINYLDAQGEPNVHEDAGVQAQYAGGDSFDETTLPTLYLPVNKQAEIKLDSRDVAHSFWVPQFLYKKDAIPGVHNNYWTVTPQKEGTFQVKCAELCGEYHSMMLMNIKVVSEAEYQARLTELREKGNVGALDDDLDRRQNLPGNGATAAGAEEKE